MYAFYNRYLGIPLVTPGYFPSIFQAFYGLINAMRILIIEDDHRLTRLIKQVLEEEKMTVDVAHDGDIGLELALRGMYDVAVIDWMLPRRDGPSICRAIRAEHLPTALLLLTARSQVEDRVAGLDSGADDYLTKPFSFEELLARIRALSRRFDVGSSDHSELRCGGIVLDLRAHTARRGNTPLDLSTTEWNLLECLLRHPRQALTRQQILDYVWSYECEVQPSLVEVYISYLRQKLNQPGKRDPIQTVRGVGYRLEPDDA
jgi:two-component system, OmpR family, response regulator